MASKTVTVFGATGKQGFSVIQAIEAVPELKSTYKIRGVTRDTSKESAQKLHTEHGVELVQADMNDPASLRAAVKGSFTVFAVTDFWASMSKATEITQGKNIADASKAEGVKLIIWSGLESATEHSDGKITSVHHFDSKAEITAHIESLRKQSPDFHSVYVQPGVYVNALDQFIHPGPDGVPSMSMPWDADKTMIPWTEITKDYGKFVAGALQQALTPEGLQKINGCKIRAVSGWRSPQQTVAAFVAAGQEVKFVPVSADIFKSYLPEPIREEIGGNIDFIREPSYYGKDGNKEPERDNWILPKGLTLTTVEAFIKSKAPFTFK